MCRVRVGLFGGKSRTACMPCGHERVSGSGVAAWHVDAAVDHVAVCSVASRLMAHVRDMISTQMGGIDAVRWGAVVLEPRQLVDKRSRK